MSEKLQRVLITGATGFIGKHVTAHLLSAGVTCRILVRSSSTDLPAADETVYGDISDTSLYPKLVSNVDAVVYCAARVHVMHETAADPLAEFRKINTTAAVNLARAAQDAGVKHFIYISSVGVMGDTILSSVSLKENDTPHPTSPYGISKWEAETQLSELFNNDSLCTCTILRPPIVYGPGNKGNMLLFLKCARNKIPLPLAGVQGKRSMVYVGNVADAILRVLNFTPKHRQPCEAYFITDAKPQTSGQLYSGLYWNMNNKRGLLWIPEFILRLPGLLHPKLHATLSKLLDSYCVSPNKFCAAYSWNPPYSFEQGIAKTVEWYITLQKH